MLRCAKLPQIPSEDTLIQKNWDCMEMGRLTSVINNDLDELFKTKRCEVYTFINLGLNVVA